MGVSDGVWEGQRVNVTVGVSGVAVGCLVIVAVGVTGVAWGCLVIVGIGVSDGMMVPGSGVELGVILEVVVLDGVNDEVGVNV